MLRNLHSTLESGDTYQIMVFHLSLRDEKYQNFIKESFNDSQNIIFHPLRDLFNIMGEIKYSENETVFCYVTGHSGRWNKVTLGSVMKNVVYDGDEIRRESNPSIDYLLNLPKLDVESYRKTQKPLWNKFIKTLKLRENEAINLAKLGYTDYTKRSDYDDPEVISYLNSKDFFPKPSKPTNPTKPTKPTNPSKPQNPTFPTNPFFQKPNNNYFKDNFAKPLRFISGEKNIFFRSFLHLDGYLRKKNVQVELKYVLPFCCELIDSEESYIEVVRQFITMHQYKKVKYGIREGEVVMENKDIERRITWLEYLDIMVIDYAHLEFLRDGLRIYDEYKKVMIPKFTYQNLKIISQHITTKPKDSYVFFDKNKKIKDNELRDNFINKIPPNVKVRIVTDMCFSGTIFDLDYDFVPNSKKSWVQARTITPTEKRNVLCINACSDYEMSYKEKFGFFTAAIHENVEGIVKKNILKRILNVEVMENDTNSLQKLYDDIVQQNKIIYLQNTNSRHSLHYIPTPQIQTCHITPPPTPPQPIPTTTIYIAGSALLLLLISTTTPFSATSLFQLLRQFIKKTK